MHLYRPKNEFINTLTNSIKYIVNDDFTFVSVE